VEHGIGVVTAVVDRAAVDIGALRELDLDPADDPERSLAATEPPEQVTVLLGGHMPQLAVAGDDIKSDDPIGGHSEGPHQRPDSTAGEKPDDADTHRRPGDRRQTMRRRRLDDGLPDNSRADPCAARLGIDRQLVEASGVDQQDIIAVDLDDAVTGALNSHPIAVRGGEPNRLDDVIAIGHRDHGRRVHPDGRVEARAQLVARFIGQRQCAVQPGAQRLEPGGPILSSRSHRVSFSFGRR
jgi:hypothetical protein